jgi:hypothetical protein
MSSDEFMYRMMRYAYMNGSVRCVADGREVLLYKMRHRQQGSRVKLCPSAG